MPQVDDKNLNDPPSDMIAKSAKSMPFDSANPSRFEGSIQIPVPTVAIASGYAKPPLI
jgi:hypothetical protein